MPKINAGDNELRGQMARGPVGPTMPNMSPSPPGMNQRGLAGMAGAPGMQAKAIKVLKATPRLGPTAGPKGPTLQSVRAHGLAMGGLSHSIKIAKAEAPHHVGALQAMHDHHAAHVAAYRSSAPKSFGSLGAAGKSSTAGAMPAPGGQGVPNKAGALVGGAMPRTIDADDGM